MSDTTNPAVQDAKAFWESVKDEDDSGTTDEVRPMELTVEDLMVLLGDMPADSRVALITKGGEAEKFTVTLDDNTSWVLLEG
jgi:hypothetical protein